VIFGRDGFNGKGYIWGKEKKYKKSFIFYLKKKKLKKKNFL